MTARQDKTSAPETTIGMRKVLLVRQENGKQREYDITRMTAVSLGTHRDNDIVLSGDEVDDFHAAIYHDRGGQRLLQDLGSRHLCRVNGTECECRYIGKSDVITIDNVTLVYDELPARSRAKKQEIGLSDCEPIQIKELATNTNADDFMARVLAAPESIRLLYEVAHLANAAHDAELSLQAVTEHLHQSFGADRTFVARFHNEDRPLDLITCCPEETKESLQVSRAIIRRLLGDRQPLVSMDIGSDERFFAGQMPTKSVLSYEFRSIVWLPLVDDGKVSGLFCLEWQHGNKNKHSEELLRALSLELSVSFNRYVRSESLRERVDFLENVVAEEGTGQSPIGISKPFRELIAKAGKIAGHDGTVLITGPTGSGKQVIAEFIHNSSTRRQKPFVQVNCAGIPEKLLESELFGVIAGYPGFHNKEALIGKFEQADGGTIFLDEIGDMPQTLQAKLLLVLEQKKFSPLGGKEKTVDVKIISATNKDLERAMNDGTFREDLFERLNMFQIDIPPLEKRMADVPLIAGFLLHVLRKQTQKNISRFSRKSMEKLRSHSWPRNVRELCNQVTRAFYSTDGPVILPHDLELAGRKRPFATLAEVEREQIQKALQATGGKMEPAARLLGIVKQTLYNKCDEYGLRPGELK